MHGPKKPTAHLRTHILTEENTGQLSATVTKPNENGSAHQLIKTLEVKGRQMLFMRFISHHVFHWKSIPITRH